MVIFYKKLLRSNVFRLAFGGLIIFVGFSNCGRVTMYTPSGKTNNSASGVSQTEYMGPTKLLEEFSFSTVAGKVSNDQSLEITKYFPSFSSSASNSGKLWSLNPDSSPSSIKTLKGGVITITSQDTTGKVLFNYLPAPGFRGLDRGKIYALVPGQSVPGLVLLNITVTNPDSFSKPITMAVRGLGCVMCHANISGRGSVVTDFGKGLGLGFFGSKKFFGVYGDHLHSFQTAMISSEVSLVVPSGSVVPFSAASPQVVVAPEGFTGAIQQKSDSFVIAAPTKSSLLRFKLPNYQIAGLNNAYYFKDSDQDSAEIRGVLQDPATGVVYNDLSSGSNFVCDGDIVVDGVVRLTNLRLESSLGCRIYATGTIFLDGPVSYMSTTAINTNLQLSSSTAVVLGVGNIISQSLPPLLSCTEANGTNRNFQYCENTNVLKARIGYFKQENPLDCKVTPNVLDSLMPNWMGNDDFFMIRDLDPNGTTTQHLLAIAMDSDRADATNVAAGSASATPRVDATCTASGGSINFDRLLLNAPLVQGRYSGLFSGMIIAEILLWSPDNFQIINDNVFSRVPILPLLDMNEILKIPSN